MSKFKEIQTLIFIDWDDTLFPTSWILQKTSNMLSKDIGTRYMVYFSELDQIVFKLLTKLLQCGKVMIVTNAFLIWIQHCGSFLTKTYKLISKQIPVISARTIYQGVSQNMNKWKEEAFQRIATKYLKDNNIQNIISIGDAEYEYHALIQLNKNKQNTRYLKSIRFIQNPSYDDLIDQQEVLYKNINKLCQVKKHLDLKFESFA